ncbi:hypothetical protein [Tuberibacillus sp. Marseille-P3662]|uniref:hypothetical protein n=1 Tax=Tuberibacillus sp. Marseille-P3662 TaxID=1965358 RepID=UPI000A1C93DB|nr:hypothetical protein [Tuberibacillus sp. Marseille-P3662]
MKKYSWVVPFLLASSALVFLFMDINFWFTICPLLLLLGWILNFLFPKGEGRNFNFGCLIGVTLLIIVLIFLWFGFWFLGGDFHPED